MIAVSRRRAVDVLEVFVGGGLVLLALYLMDGTFGPIEEPGHVDGRGFHSHLVIPPVAALSGGVLDHVVLPRLPRGRRIARYVAVHALSVLAVVPCVGYILSFGDPVFSKSLATYRICS